MRASLASKLLTFWRLGIGLGLNVIIHRLGLRAGIHPVCRISSKPVACNLFLENPNLPFSTRASRAQLEPATAPLVFGHMALDDPRLTKAANAASALREVKWWKIPDFNSNVGDIKLVWEPSRLDERVYFAQLYVRYGDSARLAELNGVVLKWVRNNVPYRGANWKCAQETSLRVLNLATAAMVLDDFAKPGPGLVDFILMHMKRISPTTSYAAAQCNNHIISESAALLIGGSWLLKLGVPKGAVWAQKGRQLLNMHTCKLVGKDGGFSQYSTNYQRLLLDILSLVNLWTNQNGIEKLSSDWRFACQRATRWLGHHVIADQGRVPVLGSNDGAKILRLGVAPLDDYRPSVQLASVLFLGKPYFPSTASNNCYLDWLGVSAKEPLKGASRLLNADDTGFLVARHAEATLFLRHPRFRFRPSQSDLLHLGLWVNGEELLCDAGTYSYASTGGDEFKKARFHNTVEFDARDQMPNISRFLYGSWPNSKVVLPASFENDEFSFGVEYQDFKGAHHQRRARLTRSRLEVTDLVEGFRKSATIGWNLPDQTVTVTHGRGVVMARSKDGLLSSIRIETTGTITSAGLIQRSIAPHYFERLTCQRLEMAVSNAARFTTIIEW